VGSWALWDRRIGDGMGGVSRRRIERGWEIVGGETGGDCGEGASSCESEGC
jgi:hypothetical protein